MNDDECNDNTSNNDDEDEDKDDDDDDDNHINREDGGKNYSENGVK